MAVCKISGKKVRFGNKRSHSNKKTRRSFKPNIQSHHFVLENGQRITLKICSKVRRTIDKYGIDSVLATLKEAK